MSDEIARKTAEDFRLLGGQAPRPAPPDPFNAPGPAADANIGAQPAQPAQPAQGSGTAAVEAALERALAKVMAGQPGGGVPADEIMARLDEMKARAGERDDEMAFELRNGLPSRIRREINEQLRPTEDRLAALERRLTAEPPRRGLGSFLAAGALFAMLTGLILCAVVIFERPLRHWGQDNVLPLFGFGLPIAQRVQPQQKNAPPLGDR